VTAVAPRRVVSRPFPVQRAPRGAKFLQYLHTTDPKVLGLMYIATSFTWFMIGGLMALFMRAELARPGMQFLAPEQYNQYENAFSRGNATSGAPICNGSTKFANPKTTAVA